MSVAVAGAHLPGSRRVASATAESADSKAQAGERFREGCTGQEGSLLRGSPAWRRAALLLLCDVPVGIAFVTTMVVSNGIECWRARANFSV